MWVYQEPIAYSISLLRRLMSERGVTGPYTVISRRFIASAGCGGSPSQVQSNFQYVRWVSVESEEGAGDRIFFIKGDGAGNAVLQQKYPDPYFNF